MFREVHIVKKLVLFSILALTPALPAVGQIRQAQGKTADERQREKTEQVLRTDEEYKQLANRQGSNSPAFLPARMNVDVQMVIAKTEFKNFAEAKAAPVAAIGDGEPVWLFVKFNGKLGQWVYRLRDGNGGERYLIFVEYGPQGDSTAKSHSIIEFHKKDLAATELKFSLAPGKAGHNNSLAIFIANISKSTPGRWMNEIRFANNPGFPRGPQDYLAKAGFAADFTKGFTKYPKMPGVFESMVLRDSTDETKLPLEGKFNDEALRSELFSRLAADTVTPTRVYFAGDAWHEYSEEGTSQRQFRTVTAVFPYRREQTCLYGIATITQTYKVMEDTYGDTKIAFKKDLPTPCIAE